MNKLTEYDRELFKEIDPSKKFSKFSYEELESFESIRVDHFCKGSIVEIYGKFYIYAGKKTFEAYESRSFVRFKSGQKTVYETSI